MTDAVDPGLAAARFFAFGLSLLIFGAAAFDLYAPPARPRARVWRIGAPVALALSVLAYLILLAREASGEPGWPGAGLVLSLGVSTTFGTALLSTSAIAVALCGLAASGRDLRRPRAVLTGGALVALAFVGHAADDIGIRGVVRLSILALHLLAIGAWLGALPLLWRTLAAREPPPIQLLLRFGLVGGVSVGLVLLTGLATLAFMLATAGGRLGPAYTRALLIKLTFVAGLLGLAAINRLWLTPMMARDPDRARTALRRSIVLEQALGLGALASVSVLGQLDPTM
ncbi:MAG TPA: CopD family protein [Caulobacteraceae bacterium]